MPLRAKQGAMQRARCVLRREGGNEKGTEWYPETTTQGLATHAARVGFGILGCGCVSFDATARSKVPQAL